MTFPDLTSVDELKGVLRKYDVQPSRGLGQNFLICREVVEAAVALMQEAPDCVTELGPGVGTLTQGLAMNGFSVRAIEKDDEFAEIIPQVLPPKVRGAVEITHADMMEADWTWDTPYQLAGNIPYNLSGRIIRQLTQLDPIPEQAVLLVQKEVGERLAAKPPHMNLIGLAVQLWGGAQPVMNVPSSCFYPAPRVDSQLVLLVPRRGDIGIEERERILDTAKVFFQQRRKQMGGVLKRSFGLDAKAAEEALKHADVRAELRPQELSISQWQTLTASLPS